MREQAMERTAGEGGQFLTFRLSNEQFGLEILRVQEIKGYSAITPIPNAPAHVKGVMNLRGAVVPVVDLRLKFGMPAIEYSKFTVIILVTVHHKVVGLVVDAVSDVLTLGASDIVAPPEFDESVDMTFLKGMAKSADLLISLLDIDRVIGLVDVPAGAAA
jgi:purine-binding chemotaxis protein CheW